MDNSRKNLHCLPLERSFEVTRGHQPSFANNFWSKRDRDLGLVSVRLSWPGKSNDMQYDPFRSSRDLGLTWPEVKLWPWPFKVNLYMVRRALTRQTRWYQTRCSTFNINDFIVEKPFWKSLEFWPLVTSILTWAKKWPKWFRNDFSRAFERCLLFFSTATRSRDHGGGGVQTPPPPSRRWKIQRPSRARASQDSLTLMQHDLLGSPRDLDLRSDFDLDLSRIPCVYRCVLRLTRWYQNKVCVINTNNISVKRIC